MQKLAWTGGITIFVIFAAATSYYLGLIDISKLPQSPKSSVSTVDLLRSGDATACSRQDVRDTLISQVRPSDKDFGLEDPGDFQNGQADLSYNLDTISLSSVDKSVSSVTCDANLVVHYKGHDDKTYSVSYKISPSVEDPNAFILHDDTSDAHGYAVDAAREAAEAIAQVRRQAQEQLQAQQQQQAQQQALANDQSSDQASPPPQDLLPAQNNM